MRTELDSHANTCVAGRNTLLVSDEGRQVTVHPYSGEYKPIQDVSIATVATMWIHPLSLHIRHDLRYVHGTCERTVLFGTVPTTRYRPVRTHSDIPVTKSGM